MSRFWGFARWNTTIFITFISCSYIFFIIGNTIALAVYYDALSNRFWIHGPRIVEAGLIIQSIFLLLFTILVWRWRIVSRDWDVPWDSKRKFKWTWKQLLTAVMICIAMLMVRQVFMIVVFFGIGHGTVGLHFGLDVAPILGECDAK
jgi:hypothetical protein